jgi:hypothetical protein
MLAGIRLPGLKLLMLGFRVIFPHARNVGVLGVYVVYLDNPSVVTSYLPSPDNLVGVPIRQPDTPASQAIPRTPTFVPRFCVA